MKTTSSYEALVFSQRQRNIVYEEVVRALESASKEHGITRSEIAKRLGFTKSHISQLLSGPGNWTIDTVSNLLFAVDAEMQCKAIFFSEMPKANRFHLAGEPQRTSIGVNRPEKVVTGTEGVATFRAMSEAAE